MKTSQYRSRRKGTEDKASARRPRTLRALPAFAPILGGWGALLGALVVLVLPLSVVDQVLGGNGLAGLGPQVQWLLAALAAAAMGSILYLIAVKLSVKAAAPSAPDNLIRGVSSLLRPIDPYNDLGSPSFDEPMSDRPFAAWRLEPLEEPRETSKPVEAAPASPPRELDLSQFAELPGRNAVWVDETVAEPHHASAMPQAPTPAPAPVLAPTPVPASAVAPAPVPPSATALARLRAVPPEELSTVQMVERFAAALHEHRDPATGKTIHSRVAASREAALAEALKALATLSDQDNPSDTRKPLRDAMAQLQSRRGAA